MKKIISCILIFSLMITIFPFQAIAETLNNEDLVTKQNNSKKVIESTKTDSETSIDKEALLKASEERSPQEPINAEVIQPADVDDFLYGHSVYYNALKQLGRKDTLDKIKNNSKEDKLSNQNKSTVAPNPELATMLTASTTEVVNYNNLIGPSTMNGVKNEKYGAWKDVDELVAPDTGELTISTNDIFLPGRNGLDLNISRVYQSNQSILGDRKFSPTKKYSYTDYSTYLINRYNLGMGWSFGFPSVQVEESEGTSELYYHTGDGRVYHVNFTTDESDSNLEDYYLKDVKFDHDTSFSNGQVSSEYVLIEPNQTKQFFANDGRLLGIADRFGNKISFEHKEAPVTNRVQTGILTLYREI